MKMHWLVGTACSAIGVLSLAPAAYADTHATLDVATGVRAASNPYLVSGTNPGSGSVSIEAAPTVEVTNDVSTLSVRGSARLDQYFKTYGSDFSGRADISYDRHISETNHFRLAGAFASTLGGSRDLLQTNLGSSTGSVINPNGDISALGARFRQYQYGADARLFLSPSARDNIELGGGLNFFDANSPLAQPYREYLADVSYQRGFSEALTVGPKLSYSRIDYRTVASGDADVITAELAMTYRMSETLTIRADAGASFISLQQLVGARVHDTAFVGGISFCDTTEKTETCLRARRSVRGTAVGGVSTETSVDFEQSWRLSERDTVKLGGGYGRNDQPAISAAQFGANRSRLVNASAVYTRALSERLFLDLGARFERAWGRPVKRDANVVALATLRYRFGQ